MTLHKTPEQEPTIKIKLECSLVARDPFGASAIVRDYPRGAVVEWREDEARRYIEKGMAVEADPDADVWLPGKDFVPAHDPAIVPKYQHHAD